MLAPREADAGIDLDLVHREWKLEHRHIGNRIDFGKQMNRLDRGPGREGSRHAEPQRHRLPVVGQLRQLQAQAFPARRSSRQERGKRREDGRRRLRRCRGEHCRQGEGTGALHQAPSGNVSS
jgi:hypothetical protein